MAVRACSLARLSRDAAIPYRTAQDYLAGRFKLPLSVAARIAAALSVSLDWLATGKVPFDRVIVIETLAAVQSGGHNSLRDRALAFADFYQSLYRDEYDLDVTAAPPDVPIPKRRSPVSPRPPISRPPRRKSSSRP
jgi:hypothetical protein